jgi:hypothetical protein
MQAPKKVETGMFKHCGGRINQVIFAARCSSAIRRLTLAAGLVAAAGVSVVAVYGQQGVAEGTPRPIVIPNRSLDTHELKELAEKNERKRNFDAANAARKLQIDDETNRLLILARDLKEKTDKMGSGRLPAQLVREAEVIELLANDVKQKMKLTVTVD